MAVAVALFIAGTAVIFVRLQPLVSDYVSLVTPRPPAPTSIVATGTLSGRVAGEQSPRLPRSAPTPTPASTPAPAVFTPDLLVNPVGPAVRLRAEPSASGGDATIVDTLAPGTELQATGRQDDATDPAQPGVLWLEVQTAAGQQGWIRQIDTVPTAP